MAEQKLGGTERFPTFLTHKPKPKCILEERLSDLSSCIRLKENWEEKMKDESISYTWFLESQEEGVSADQFQFVMDRLQYMAGLSDGENGIRVAPVDGVYESDKLIPPALQSQLCQASSALEKSMKDDWHPGSDGKVLDLVHPSLFPLVSGVSRVVSEEQQDEDWRSLIGKGETITGKLPDYGSSGGYYSGDEFASKKFQWLPSDVLVDPNGTAVFDSYINNLHPDHHPELYEILEKILSCFIPIFNKVLTQLRSPWKNLIQFDPYNWYPDFPYSDDEEEQDRYYEERTPKQPTIPKAFEAPPPFPHPVDLSGRRLQVIVKLANIVLTPDKPSYSGGSWHVEGMINECIVASGIYYYQNENITESRLWFRQSIDEPEYEQNDERGVKLIYGLEDDDCLYEELGYITCRENRVIAFPNVLQHRVSPFELLDKTKPGVRKILAFFLVDPTLTILSTKRVPPQQQDWNEPLGRKRPLPESTENVVKEHLEFPVSMARAKAMREELMKERSKIVETQTNEVFERGFSLCEH